MPLFAATWSAVTTMTGTSASVGSFNCSARNSHPFMTGIQIEEDHAEPRRVRAEVLQRLLPVRGFHHAVAFAFEDGRERAPHVGVVLHDQDALRLPLHLSLIWPVGSTRLGTEARSSTDVRGSRTTNVAPCPSPS